MQRLHDEIKQLREIGAGAIAGLKLALPEGLPPSSADVIASLNEHLVHALQVRLVAH